MNGPDDPIAVFGLGYVGCVTAACLSRDGYRVFGVDIDADKVAAVNSGMATVAEPGLDDLVRQGLESARLSATTDVELAVRSTSLALVAVGTPSAVDGSVDSGAVEGVVEQIGTALRGSDRHYTLVIRSTLLPGILEERLTPILDSASGFALGGRISLCNNPEFLRETTAIADYGNPPFVVVGAGRPEEAEPVLALYDGINAEKIVTDTRSAAMVKYACNSYHAVKIAFANEIGTLAHAMGADGQEVMRIACRDRQLNVSPAYLRPGFAFGGSCLPKDVRALSRFGQVHALQLQLLHSVLESNTAHIERGLAAIRDTGCRRIGLAGLSFKAGSDDLRESPLVALAELLVGKGYDLRIYDPGVCVSDLVGTNRTFVERHLPHLASLLVREPFELFEHSELLVIGTGVADDIDWGTQFAGETIDLRRDLVAASIPEPQTAFK